MTFSIHPEQLQQNLTQVLGEQVEHVDLALGEVTVHVSAANYLAVMQTLRDAPLCQLTAHGLVRHGLFHLP